MGVCSTGFACRGVREGGKDTLVDGRSEGKRALVVYGREGGRKGEMMGDDDDDKENERKEKERRILLLLHLPLM